jgi:hypothetical protein
MHAKGRQEAERRRQDAVRRQAGCRQKAFRRRTGYKQEADRKKTGDRQEADTKIQTGGLGRHDADRIQVGGRQ